MIMITYNKELRCFTSDLSDDQREFGWKSKVLGFISPGAWQAKEAAKYGYDTEDEYKKHRWKYALKGYFSPLTAMYVNEKVKKMDKQGKSRKEIRDYLENKVRKPSLRRVAGTAEVAGKFISRPFNIVSGITSIGKSLYDVAKNRRHHFDK